LVIEPVREYTVEALRELLEQYGPLWMGEASPGLHVVVIAGLLGDGTPEGTFVRVADPWPIGSGERYTIPFSELRRNFDAVEQLTGVRACVLHVGGAPRGNRHLSWERSVTARLSGRPSQSRGAPMHKYVVDCGHGGLAAAGKSTPYGSRGASGTAEKDI